MDVGIVGLGTMGGRMAERLIEARHRVIAFDVSSAAREQAAASRVEIAASVADVAASTSVVLLSLPTPEHVESVVTGPNGILERPAPELVVVDTSTVDPDTTRRMAARAARSGIAYLDAPVLGRPDSCGAWTFPVGGDEEALARARPALEVLGKNVIHTGHSGTGNAIKLLNNLMFGAINSVTAEAMALCEAVGIPPAAFLDVVSDSGAATVSPLFRQSGRKIVDGDSSPTFTIDLMHKDVALAAAMAGGTASGLTMANAVLSLTEAAREAGIGGEDTSAIVKVYRSRLDS